MAHKNKSNWSPYKARQNDKQTSSPKDNLKGNPKDKLKGKHKQPEKLFSLNEANDRLYDLFNHHGFKDFPHDKRKKLAEFYLLLMETQKKENFTRLLNLRDVGIKHFIDCMIVAELTELKFPLMDVGTGPGFPGIPLKILFPQELILLAEGVQRRVEFLKEVREKLELEQLLILGRNINPECFYPVNGVITRAVEEIRNTLGNVINSLQTGGCVYFMKGPGVDPELKSAQESWGEYYELIQDKAYNLPNTPHERRLLVYKKIKPFEVSEEFFESLGLQDDEETKTDNFTGRPIGSTKDMSSTKDGSSANDTSGINISDINSGSGNNINTSIDIIGINVSGPVEKDTNATSLTNAAKDDDDL